MTVAAAAASKKKKKTRKLATILASHKFNDYHHQNIHTHIQDRSIQSTCLLNKYFFYVCFIQYMYGMNIRMFKIKKNCGIMKKKKKNFFKMEWNKQNKNANYLEIKNDDDLTMENFIHSVFSLMSFLLPFFLQN